VGGSVGSQRVGMSLSKPDTYKRPDAEVLPLLTEQALKQNLGHGRLPLHYAVRYNASVTVIKRMMTVYAAALQQKDNHGRLPLHYAAMESMSPEVVEVILAGNPDALQQKDNGGNLPADLAANCNSSAAVKAVFQETATPEGLARIQGRVQRARRREPGRHHEHRSRRLFRQGAAAQDGQGQEAPRPPPADVQGARVVPRHRN